MLLKNKKEDKEKNVSISNLNLYESLINEIIRNSKFNITSISIGIPCEKISIIHGYMRLCGIGLTIHPDYSEENIGLYNEVRNLQSGLYQMYRENKEGKNNLNEIKEKVYKQREISLKMGVVTFAYKAQQINNCITKSNYGNYDEKYAPFSIKLYNSEDYLKSHLDRCLEAEFSKKEMYYPMDIYVDGKIKEEELSELYDTISQIIIHYNDYIIKEYIENKDDEKYQHRHDCDPANF